MGRRQGTWADGRERGRTGESCGRADGGGLRADGKQTGAGGGVDRRMGGRGGHSGGRADRMRIGADRGAEWGAILLFKGQWPCSAHFCLLSVQTACFSHSKRVGCSQGE